MEKGDKQFERDFVTGTFQTLSRFAQLRRIKCETQNELIELIKFKYPDYRIVVNKQGEVGVEILDQVEGEYRFERGHDDYIEIHKMEAYDGQSSSAHADAWKNQLAKREAKDIDRTIYAGSDTTGNFDSLPAAASAAETNFPETQVYPETSPASSPRASTTVASAASPSLHSGPRAETPRPNPPATVPVLTIEDSQTQQLDISALRRLGASSNLSSAAASSVGSGARRRERPLLPAATDDSLTLAMETLMEEEDGQGQQLEYDHEESEAAASTNRSAGDERCLNEGKAALKKVLEDFGSDQHLDHARQSQSCSKGIDRLRKWARKLAKLADPTCVAFSQQLFDAADEVEERQLLFDECRTQFVACVSAEPSKARALILKTMTETTITSLVSKEAPRISDSALCNQMDGNALFMSLIGKGGPVKPKGVGLHLVGSDDLVKQCQRPTVHSHLESIFKQPSFNALATASENFCGGSWLGSMDQDSMMQAIDTLPETPADSEPDAPMLYGFEPQLFGDMLCCHIMGQVSRCLGNNTRIPSNIHPIIKKLVQCRGRLSGRIRSFHKHIGGISHCARDAWRAMEKLDKENVSECGTSAEEVDGWTKSLREGRAVNADKPEEVLVTLAELTCVGGAKIKDLAAWMVYAQESGTVTADNKELFQAGCLFKLELVESVKVVLLNDNLHQMVWEDTAGPDEMAAPAEGAGQPPVKDEEYYADEDNLPDSVAMACVTATVTSYIKEFPLGGSESRALSDATQLSGMIISTWKMSKYQLSDKHTAFDKIRSLADLCRKHVWSKPDTAAAAGRIVDESSPFYTIQQFNDKVSTSMFLDTVYDKFIYKQLQSNGNLSALRRELSALSSSLPTSVQSLAETAKVMDSIETAADRFKQGKTALVPTLAEMNSQLHQAVTVTAAASNDLGQTRAAYAAAKLVVGKEFGSAFCLFEAKIGKVEAAMQVFHRRAGDIVAEIRSWSFDECAFVKCAKDKPDPEMLTAARGIEAAWKQFDHLQTLAGELATRQAHQPDTVKNKAKAINEKFTTGEFGGKLKTARVELAHCSLANIIFQQAKPDDVTQWPAVTKKMLDYCRKELGIATSDLDSEFAVKLTLTSEASPKATAAKTKAKKVPAGTAAAEDETMSTASTRASSIGDSSSSNKSKFRRRK